MPPNEPARARCGTIAIKIAHAIDATLPMLESLPHLAAEQVPTATDGEFRKRREEAVRKHLEAGNRHDLEASVLTFHHPRYDVRALGSTPIES